MREERIAGAVLGGAVLVWCPIPIAKEYPLIMIWLVDQSQLKGSTMPDPQAVFAHKTFEDENQAEAYRQGLEAALVHAPYGCSYPEPTRVRREYNIDGKIHIYFEVGYWDRNANAQWH